MEHSLYGETFVYFMSTYQHHDFERQISASFYQKTKDQGGEFVHKYMNNVSCVPARVVGTEVKKLVRQPAHR